MNGSSGRADDGQKSRYENARKCSRKMQEIRKTKMYPMGTAFLILPLNKYSSGVRENSRTSKQCHRNS